ncbi:LysR substrate-binding domain-containing protein [Sphingopyxis sp. 550A]
MRSNTVSALLGYLTRIARLSTIRRSRYQRDKKNGESIPMVRYSSSIDMRHLRYFVAVVTHRSFRRAAAELNVSQPPLTRQIQQLEEILGVRLLERNSRGITLTAAGEAFYADARNILALVDQGATRANAIGQGQMGRIDVGVFGSAIFDLIPRIVLAYREKFPDVEVSLHTMSREEQVKALAERRIDVGFNRFFSDYPGLFWQTIASQRMVAAIPTENHLAKKQHLSLRDLNHQPIIFYPPIQRPGGFSNFLLRMLHERNVSVNIAQNVEDVVTAVSLVSSGFGIALGVDSVRNLNIPGVTYTPFTEKDTTTFDLCLIKRADNQKPIIEEFVRTAKTVGQSDPSFT